MLPRLLRSFDLRHDQLLISPLMGPIVAIGYGAGGNDFALIERALRTLLQFVGMSLLTATLYFAISPLSQARSELLARTSPTLWDVAIAFFGGAAGIVAITRREFSNIVPGVAIATALMPPLCTAGYGLASLNLPYFAGAFYLFSINAVFIAFATLLIVKVLRLPPRADIDVAVRNRSRLIIGTAVALTLVPSAYLAWRLVQREFFSAAAAKVVRDLSQDTRYIVLGSEVDPATQRERHRECAGTRRPPESEQGAGPNRRNTPARASGYALLATEDRRDHLSRRVNGAPVFYPPA